MNGLTGTGARPRGGLSARRGAVFLLGWLLLFLPACYGLDMGVPEVFSSVGEPLKAVVPLVDARGAPLEGQCVVTTKEATSALDRTPLATHVRTRVGRSAASTTLRITSRSPVHAPAIRLVLWLACVRERAVTRTLTLYLNTPEQTSPALVAGPGRAVQSAPQEPADALSPEVQKALPRRVEPPDREPPTNVVRVARPRAALQIDVLASASLPLKLSTVLSAPVRGSTSGRTAVNSETRPGAAGRDSVHGGTEPQATIATLQQKLGELEASRRSLLEQVQDLQATARNRRAEGKGGGWGALMGYAAFGGALLLVAGTVLREWRRSRPETDPSRSSEPAGRQALPVAEHRGAPVAIGHQPPRAAPEQPAAPSVVGGETIITGPARVPQTEAPERAVDESPPELGAVAPASRPVNVSPPNEDAAEPGPVALAMLDELQWDDGSVSTADVQTDDPVFELGAEAEFADEAIEQQLLEWDEGIGNGAPESLEEPLQPSDDALAEGVSESFEQQLQEWDDAVGELRQALYEAELHLLHGSPGEAVRLLTQQVDGHDAEFLGVRPWTMLFEVYRQQDDRSSFETLAARFRKHFNVSPPTWDSGTGADSPKGKSLEQQFPHVVERIMALWPSYQCLDYLSGLLIDDLGGARQGFSLDVAEEIELLRDVMRLQVGKGSLVRGQAAPTTSPEKRSPFG